MTNKLTCAEREINTNLSSEIEKGKSFHCRKYTIIYTKDVESQF